jgi:curved DNA-binding protein CbpA
MGNSQSQGDKYDSLKKLYSLNNSQLLALKQKLQAERSNNIMSNSTVQQTLKNNTKMQRQFIELLKQEQAKLANKINHGKYHEINRFLNSLSVDIDEYEKKQYLYLNQGTVNNFQKKTNLNNTLTSYNNQQSQITNQQLSKHSNFISKNDFEKNEKLYEEQFINEESSRRARFREDQRKRRDSYMSQIKQFKSSVDPYQLLKLPKNFTENQLKNAYRKLVMITHPDRPGGSNEKFQLVSKAYMTLLEEFKTKQADKQFVELRDDARDYMKNQMRYQKNNKDMKSKRFDLNMFNKIYSENRLHEPEDDGYEEWINNNKYNSDDIKKNELFSKKFNLNIFNTVFENENNNMTTDIVEYKEPSALNSGGNSCVILGQDKVNNFSGSSAVDYTDYKQAFTTTRLVNPNTVQRQNFKNIDDIKNARSSIQKFTPDELRELEYKKQTEQQNEEDRQYRLTKNDQKVFDNYNKVHGMFLNN